MIVYEGEPLIVMDPDGVDFDMSGGQPKMTRGWENIISNILFVDIGWIGNKLLAETEKVGCEFEQRITENPITIKNIIEFEKYAQQKISEYFSEAVVTITNPSGNLLEMTVEISEGTEVTIFINNGTRWYYQLLE